MPSTSGRLKARDQTRSRGFLCETEAGRPVRKGRGGFTLLEILVTLALMALLSAVLISGSTRLLSDRPSTPSDVFRKALTESRQHAVEKNVEVRLSFDAKEKAFKATTDDSIRSYPVPVSVGGEMNIDFVAAQKGGSAILIGGVVVDTQTLPYVTFYPDGTCSPFRIQFRLDSGVSTMAIDPWTCAPVLEAAKS
jgi:general secretion pathway protein H